MRAVGIVSGSFIRLKLQFPPEETRIAIAEIAVMLNLLLRTVENHLFIGRNEVREYIRQCI